MSARLARDWELNRLRLLYAAMLAAFALLIAQLWRLQVAQGARYERNLARQSIRRVRLPGPRGAMLDRNGQPLAENRPSFSVTLYLGELRLSKPRRVSLADHVLQVVRRLSERLELPSELTERDIRRHIQQQLPLPLTAWRDLSEESLARVAERLAGEPGVDLDVSAVRVYPQAGLACHALGYVGRAEPAEDAEAFHFQLPEWTGRAGLEKVYDSALRGSAGGQLLRVDVAGFRRDVLDEQPVRPGYDLRLALDTDVQRLAERALDGVQGACVVLDPNTGDVLALASAPGYDLNAFVPAIPRALWQTLMDDPARPLLHRAVAGVYPPGSTFKPVTALAALQSGEFTARQEISCPGYFLLGRARFGCWQTQGHGTVDMLRGIRYSCNVIFFRAGLACGHEAIADMARRAGLGAPTGIDLDQDSAGLIPDDAWKRAAQREGWRDGDTCNMAIGQGAVLATPLQMAMLAATLAAEGTVRRPRLVTGLRAPAAAVFQDIPPVIVRRLDVAPEHLRLVREGMRDVVMAEDGTGRKLRVPGVTLAGKTGTAEYGAKGSGLKRGWMIAFGPYEAPRYAVAMVVEEAVSGGSTVAPRLQQLMQGLFPAAPAPGGRG